MEIVSTGIGFCINGSCHVVAWWILACCLLVILGITASIYVALRGHK